MTSKGLASAVVNIGLIERSISGWCDGGAFEIVAGFTINRGLKVVHRGVERSCTRICAKRGVDVGYVGDNQEEKVSALGTQLECIARGELREIVSDCTIPVDDGHADLVISPEVLEGVCEPKNFLDDVFCIGKPDAT